MTTHEQGAQSPQNTGRRHLNINLLTLRQKSVAATDATDVTDTSL